MGGALILFGLLYLLARHDGDYNFYKTAFIAIGLQVVLWLLMFALKPHGLDGLALPAMLGLCVWALVRFCYISWAKAVLITFLYLVLSIAFSYGFHHLAHIS